jgi:uncharacterized Zn-binding protein involved in type VI secretion
MGNKITVLGDTSTHCGVIIAAGQSTVMVNNTPIVIANKSKHLCPIPGHGTTTIQPITVKSYVNNELIITEGSITGCGAIILSPDRKVYVE